jgi:hypothetical protein
LADARKGKFDIVVAEGLDRLSREQVTTATLFQQLSFIGIMIYTRADGEVSELHVGLKGTMNALFLKDLALKTHRGIEGRVRKGVRLPRCATACRGRDRDSRRSRDCRGGGSHRPAHLCRIRSRKFTARDRARPQSREHQGTKRQTVARYDDQGTRDAADGYSAK